VVFGPMSMTSFPPRDAVQVFVLPPKKKGGRYTPVRITVLMESPVTASLRAAKVETRTVDPPVPPVVLCADYGVMMEVRSRWTVHTTRRHSQQRDRRL